MFERIQNLIGGQRKEVTFSFSDKQLCMTIVHNGMVELFDRQIFDEFSIDTLKSTLSHLSSQYRLIGSHCRLILPSDRYQILLTENLNVPDDEMTEALKWKLKGLLEYNVDDTVLDYFSIPPHGLGEKKEMLFSVCCSQSFLMQCQNAFQEACLFLKKIDIDLLAMRALVELLKSGEGTQILLQLGQNTCHLIVLYQYQIYFIRNVLLPGVINYHKRNEEIEKRVQQEVMRTVEYVGIELRLPSVEKLLVSPRLAAVPSFVDTLGSVLGAEMIEMNLNQLGVYNGEFSSEEQAHLSECIGGALITESNEVVQGEYDDQPAN